MPPFLIKFLLYCICGNHCPKCNLQVCSKKNRRLELRFRPDDIFCKPACGDRYETDGLILKVKSVKTKNESGEFVREIRSCEIIGRVSSTFKFKSK